MSEASDGRIRILFWLQQIGSQLHRVDINIEKISQKSSHEPALMMPKTFWKPQEPLLQKVLVTSVYKILVRTESLPMFIGILCKQNHPFPAHLVHMSAGHWACFKVPTPTRKRISAWFHWSRLPHSAEQQTIIYKFNPIHAFPFIILRKLTSSQCVVRLPFSIH